MRERFCKVCRGWHDIEAWPHNCMPEPPLRSDLPTPMLISDHLGDVWNPADGKHYDSKSRYYGAVKRAGYEIAGNDSSVTKAHEKTRQVKTAPGLKEDLKRAWDTVVK
jgi:hypothetical protein